LQTYTAEEESIEKARHLLIGFVTPYRLSTDGFYCHSAIRIFPGFPPLPDFRYIGRGTMRSIVSRKTHCCPLELSAVA
jgi:hypothetical protein